ncbi:MAG: cysteine--tRNA ligase [Clostridiales bacterium]|nr:cysteine--tRNA ligase [Clostridiales bacterium]
MVKFYNSLTRQKEEVPFHDNKTIKMYSCGPTVYYYPHIGNFRAYLFMDNIRRVLKYNGYTLDGVMNITDVGHLTSDADEGEDKMLVASKRENKSPWEIAKYYTNIFMNDAKALNIDLPEHIIPATTVIDEMISFVSKLLEKGYAYETSKGIYFDITKFEEYGKLSGMDIREKLAGARIDVDEEKRSPYDFVLWVKAPKEHIMQWQSPWGMGYPGWHIECSVIGDKYLGETIDIHTGGVDHKPVHHENEIAQSNCYYDHQVVKMWMHLEFLQVDGGKMSKSLNNIYTIKDLESRGFSAEDFRYFYFMAHYSKQQNFTFDALEMAKNTLKSIKTLVKEHKDGKCDVDTSAYEQEFLSSINDDLNMPRAIATVLKMLKENRSKKIYQTFLKFNQVLGLSLDEEEIPKEIKLLAQERWQAKKDRDFAKADSLRVKLTELGYQIKDTREGFEISKI